MVPQPRDFVQLLAADAVVLRRGPAAAFEQFTYWEKFDYWAVFWGTAIMGAAGLVLWFPELLRACCPAGCSTSRCFVHGAEALLAIGFIFVVHFFNGHLRPGQVPDGHGDLHGLGARAGARARAAGRVRAAVERAGRSPTLAVAGARRLLLRRGRIDRHGRR